MNIWLVQTGEPLPSDSGSPRILRTGLMAHVLRQRGHNVTWWASSFNHVSKSFRQSAALDIELLHGCGYSRNVSLSRVINHIQLARDFKGKIATKEVPDVIVCSVPTLELANAATRYGKKNNVPVLLDLRDLWPDVIFELFPGHTKLLAQKAFSFYTNFANRLLARAAGIISLTPAFLEWGLSRAQREKSKWDRVVPMAYSRTLATPEAIEEGNEYWRQKGVGTRDSTTVVSFLGTISQQFEFHPIFEAARQLKDVQFVLCGSGDSLASIQRKASKLSNVVCPGWVNAPQILTLLRRSKIGLAPYRASNNFLLNFPNKLAEYLSEGLPIACSLRGYMGDQIVSNGCGISYDQRPEPLISWIESIHTDKTLWNRMHVSARLLYENEYCADKVYVQFAEWIEGSFPRKSHEDHGSRITF